jgi:Zn-dependent protease
MGENYWHLGRWGRIPASMHWTVLIAFAWLYLFFWDLLATAFASAAFFALLVVHELGHVAILRWRKVPVERITLYGIHGETSHGWAGSDDQILIAWGGVFAQVAVLVLAIAFSLLVPWSSSPAAALVLGPMLVVFTKLNVFVMIIALLPIGPFDGRAAWAAIPRLRRALRRWKQARKSVKLSPEQQRKLEESSAKEAAELLAKLSKTTSARKEDR